MSVQVFAYPGGPRPEAAEPGSRDRPVHVRGTMLQVEGVGPALMLAGHDVVRGELVACAPEALAALDQRARVREGVYRRVGLRVDGDACWTYVAGPKAAVRLAGSPGGRRGSREDRP